MSAQFRTCPVCRESFVTEGGYELHRVHHDLRDVATDLTYIGLILTAALVVGFALLTLTGHP